MSKAIEETYNELPDYNPINCVEDILNDNNWIYSRMNNNELLVDVAGSVFSYRICFIWQESLSAMQIICQIDTYVSAENKELAAEILMEINRSMLLGHFELTKPERSPCFRYTCLLSDINSDSRIYSNIQDIVDICLAQCEQQQTIFQILSSDRVLNKQMLYLAMIDTVGQS